MPRPSLRPLLVACLLAGCATPKAPIDVAPVPLVTAPEAAAPEPVPVEPTPVAAPVPAPERPLGDLVADASSCTVMAPSPDRRVECAHGDVLVSLSEAPEPDLDRETRATMEWFASRGARLVLLGEPDCLVDGRPGDCSFVEARGDDGRMGTAYVAVGRAAERDYALRCVYMTADRGAELADPVCSSLIELVGTAVSQR